LGSVGKSKYDIFICENTNTNKYKNKNKEKEKALLFSFFHEKANEKNKKNKFCTIKNKNGDSNKNNNKSYKNNNNVNSSNNSNYHNNCLFLNFPGIFLFEYISKNYLFLAKTEKQGVYIKQVLNCEFKVNLAFAEITSKYHNSYSVLLLSLRDNGIFLYKYLLTNIKDNEEIVFYSKILFYSHNQENSNLKQFLDLIKNSEKENNLNFNYALKGHNYSSKAENSFNSFIEFENSFFAFICNAKVFLFEKFEKQAILTQVYDVSFMDNPFPLNLFFTNYEIENFQIQNFQNENKINKDKLINCNNIITIEPNNSHNNSNTCKANNASSATSYWTTNKDYFYLLSSNKFIYKLSLKSNTRSNEFLPIFKDITLNFNNNKYIELLKSLKIIILYNLEIQRIPFKSLQNHMKSIFHEYDIYSYIENIQEILSYENIIFFINYNFNSSKIYVIILFCLVFDRADFMRKFFNLLLNLDNVGSISGNCPFNAEKKDLQGLLRDNRALGVITPCLSEQENHTYQAEAELLFLFVENYNLNKEFIFYVVCILDFLKEFAAEFECFDFLAYVREFFGKVLCDAKQGTNMKFLNHFIGEYLTN